MAQQAASKRTRYYDLATTIRMSPSVEARAAIELIGVMVEDARNRLVQASGDDMLRVQGEARALERVLRELTTQSPNQENQ